MSLLQKAVETYDNMAHLVGVPREGHQTLLPVSHIMQNAQIEVTLDAEGNFVSACEVSKEDCKTIIPATEASAGRTSGVAAHPYSDQLEYLLPINPEKHSEYMKTLSEWANSEYTHPKVKAVFRFISSGALSDKLQANNLLRLNTDGGFDNGKIAGTEYAKCLVRWRVHNFGGKDASWEDRDLMRAYEAYYEAKGADGTRGLCMISGEESLITPNHPKGITAANYGAKLISANDSSGFTYRGRFTEAWQAATVAYLSSQKAHNALRWIAADQGITQGGRTFLCWNPKGLNVPKIITPLTIGGGKEKLSPTEYKEELRRTLDGFRNELPSLSSEDVIICAFDAATTGRLSLTYYNELKASDFYERIQSWYESCCWENGRYGKPYPEFYGVQSPSLYQIIRCSFGTERSSINSEKAKIEVSDGILSEQIQRLMTCITDRAAVPYDVVFALFNKASQPLAYSGDNRSALLFTACAIIRKYLNDKAKKEEWTMAFEPEKQDRSYQFGCLLAVMEKVERDTYDREETREPNAIRLQSVFCKRPMQTAAVLNERLQPYFARLKPSVRAFYKKRIGEIMSIISSIPEEQNRPLRESYLMGYYLQRQALYTKNVNDDNRTEE